LSDIFCPTTRARMSFAPPARNGTTSLIGLLGKSACACAGLAAVADPRTSAARARNVARGVIRHALATPRTPDRVLQVIEPGPHDRFGLAVALRLVVELHANLLGRRRRAERAFEGAIRRRLR